MDISLEMVRDVFRSVLNGQMTREAADRWAHSVVKQFESDSLTFVPASDEKRIWDGVMFLYGVDTLKSPAIYLHSDDDIFSAMKEKIGSGC